MKIVVVLSGGMDSAVLLAKLLDEGHEVKCITFDYGSKHGPKEQQAAKELCAHYNVQHFIYRLNVSGLLESNLLSSGGEIPDGHYAAPNMKQTVVPFRNAIMLSLAVGYAESHGCQAVAIGAHSGDHYIYPDCRPGFLTSMREAALNGTDNEIDLIFPFSRMTKGHIAALGAELRVPFEKTWTCYKGQEVHCGTCGSCSERKEAFIQAGVEDPTIYTVQGLEHVKEANPHESYDYE